jgi:hypothetical protein
VDATRYCVAQRHAMELSQASKIGPGGHPQWLRSYSGGAQHGASSLGNCQTVQLTIGEVHTGLLLTSTAVPADTATALLSVLPGSSVRTRERPVRYAWSPEVLTGVDCLAPVAGQREVRLVGTPATRLSLTDGHIVQAGTHASFRHESTGRRRSWAHYLAQPGVLEVLGTVSQEKLVTGFLNGPANTRVLDLGAVNVRTLAAIQRSTQLDHNPPFHSRRTSLRWTAEFAEGQQEMVFTLGADGLRTVRLRSSELDPQALADFCADLALHDWLLSALVGLVERAVARRRPAAELVGMLRPAIDHLVHAWMPAAHVKRTLTVIWQDFDARSGFSLQWQKTVQRIRDQLSVGIIEALQPLTEPKRRSEPHDPRRNPAEPDPGPHHEDRAPPAPRADHDRVVESQWSVGSQQP